MDKEKLLKKYIFAFTVQVASACTFWFLFLVRKYFDINIFLPLLLVIPVFISSVYIDKHSLAVMPMIISRYDTVEKYQQQNFRLFIALILYTVFSIFIVYKFDSVFTRFLSSFLWRFNPFININHRRIEYLKSKPEGLNF